MPWYKDKFLIRFVAVLAFVKTLFFLYIYFKNPLGEQVLIFPDSLGYVYPAQTLLTYGHFWEAVTANPLILRTPGYPLFLALIQFGIGNLTWAVAIVQNILSILLILPVYLTTRDLAGERASRISAILTAISVLYFSLSFAVLTEILCAFLLAWFVYFSLRFTKTPRMHTAVGAAIFLAAAIYVRPAAYYFAFVSCVFFFCTFRTYWKQILCAFVLPLLVFLGAWHLRNFCTTGYAGFSTVNAYNLYFWNEDFVAQKNGLSIPQANEWLQARLPKNFDSLPTREQVKAYRFLGTLLLKAGWKYKLLNAPRWAAKTLLGTNFIHTSRLLLGVPEDEQTLAFNMLNQTKNLHHDFLQSLKAKLIFGISFVQIFLTLLLALLGVLSSYKKAQKALSFLTIYCLYFWGIGSVFFGAYARFRAPFEFVLCILGGLGANALIPFLQAQCKRINQKGR